LGREKGGKEKRIKLRNKIGKGRPGGGKVQMPDFLNEEGTEKKIDT